MKIVVLIICAMLVASVAGKEPIKKKSGEKLLKGKRESPSGSYLPPSNAYLPPSKGYLPPTGSGASNFGPHGAVETYIITSGLGGGFGGGKGFGSGGHSFGGGFGGAKHGLGFGGLGVGVGRSKLHTVAVPSQSYGHPGIGEGYSISPGLNGHGGLLGVGSFGGDSGSIYGHGAHGGFSGGSLTTSHALGGGSFGGHLHGGSIGHGQAGNNYASHLFTSFPKQTSASPLGGLSFGGGYGIGGGHSFGNDLSFGGGHSFGGGAIAGPGYTIGHGDHTSSIGALGAGHGIGSSEIPSGSYGVPLAPPISSYTPQIEVHPSHGGLAASGVTSGYETPSYAAGHKGLSHYQSSGSYRGAGSTKVLALDSGYDLSGTSGHSKAPFRPSVFLGASHEVAVPSKSYGVVSQEYGPPETSGHGGEYDGGLGNPHGGVEGSNVQASYLPPVIPQKAYVSHSSSSFENSPTSSSNYAVPNYSTINYSSAPHHGHH